MLEYYIFRGIFKVVEKKINQINEKTLIILSLVFLVFSCSYSNPKNDIKPELKDLRDD